MGKPKSSTKTTPNKNTTLNKTIKDIKGDGVTGR